MESCQNRLRSLSFYVFICWLLNMLAACAHTSTAGPENQQDLGSILSRFDALRKEMQVPYARLSLEPNPFIAAAKGLNSIVMDEDFANSLSNPALDFVLIHELAHLRHQDPRKGLSLLRKIHAENGGENTLDFMSLWGKYSSNPEFQNMVQEIEARADSYAVDYLSARNQDACAAGQELELKTGRSFGERIGAMCERGEVPTPRMDDANPENTAELNLGGPEPTSEVQVIKESPEAGVQAVEVEDSTASRQSVHSSPEEHPRGVEY